MLARVLEVVIKPYYLYPFLLVSRFAHEAMLSLCCGCIKMQTETCPFNYFQLNGLPVATVLSKGFDRNDIFDIGL